MEAGASGITCAKVSEAEVMANAGMQDIFIAYCIVDIVRLERLARLSERCKMSVGVDSREAAQAISDFFSVRDQRVDVLMEIDTGHHRCGVTPERACEFAEFLTTLKGIRPKGVFTHEGHVYQQGAIEDRRARAEQAGKVIACIATGLRERRVLTEVVSVGSSPAQDAACQVQGVTENRPGTNIFNDCTQVHLGACGWDDCALTYECTVVSRPSADRAVIDGGSKTFSSDQLSDWGDVGVVKECPGAKFSRASEEHGILSLTDARSQALRIGHRVRVIPSHVCGSVNLHNRAFVEQNGEIVDEWKIEARGCVE